VIYEDFTLTMQLGLAAKLLNEIEDQRKRNVNRREVLIRPRDKPDADGVCRGFGYPADEPAVQMLDAHIAVIESQERTMTGELERAVKRHQLASWIKAQRGLGEKQLGRLLAAIGDPSWHPVENRPRTLWELNSYCGQVPGMRRERGVPADEADQWNAEAKMRLFLIAEKASTQLDKRCKIYDPEDPKVYLIAHAEDCRCGPYRKVYEHRRAWTAERLHSNECRQCGPSGKPAQPGSPLSAKHRHMDALRYVGKRILRDLYREARRINGFADEMANA
jgi:hypothetical protein